MDLTLNNLQNLICHKTQRNNSISNNSVEHKYTVCQNDLFFKLFSLVKQFHFKQFSLAEVHSFVLFNP